MHPFEDVVDAFAAGVYLLFGVVYLDLARRRHGQGGPLWLAAACFGALTVDLTGMMARHRLPERDALLHAVNLGAAALTTVFLRELASSLARERSGFATRALEALSVPLAAGAALAGSPPLALGAFALILLLLGGALVTTARIPRGGAPEAMLVAVGFAILLFCLIGDVLMLVGVLPRLFGLPVAGFVSFFLAAAIATNRRSERERIELEQLRSELEGRVEDRTRELSAANDRLAEASRTDTLTGLLNRRGFLAAWETDQARASRSGRPTTLVLADLDRFKDVNDSAGHLVGDALLQRVAATFPEILRAQDVAARWGGEEFIFLLPETALAGGIEVAEKLRRALADRSFGCEGVEGIRITASFGVAEQLAGERLERTVAAADAALYRAKDAGRNRVEAAGPASARTAGDS